jgi:hypothetical protein
MELEKIAAFYDDSVKLACDRFCIKKAHALKALSTDPGWRWQVRRLAKFFGNYGRGIFRRLKPRFASQPRPGRSLPMAS